MATRKDVQRIMKPREVKKITIELNMNKEQDKKAYEAWMSIDPGERSRLIKQILVDYNRGFLPVNGGIDVNDVINSPLFVAKVTSLIVKTMLDSETAPSLEDSSSSRENATVNKQKTEENYRRGENVPPMAPSSTMEERRFDAVQDEDGGVDDFLAFYES